MPGEKGKKEQFYSMGDMLLDLAEKGKKEGKGEGGYYTMMDMLKEKWSEIPEEEKREFIRNIKELPSHIAEKVKGIIKKKEGMKISTERLKSPEDIDLMLKRLEKKKGNIEDWKEYLRERKKKLEELKKTKKKYKDLKEELV